VHALDSPLFYRSLHVNVALCGIARAAVFSARPIARFLYLSNLSLHAVWKITISNLYSSELIITTTKMENNENTKGKTIKTAVAKIYRFKFTTFLLAKIFMTYLWIEQFFELIFQIF
jgi:hypothetical protein